MRKCIIVGTLFIVALVFGFLFLMFSAPAQAREIEPDWTWKIAPSDTTNNRAMCEIYMEELKSKIAAIIEEQEAQWIAEEQSALEEQAYWEYTVPDTTYYEPSSGITYYGVQGDPDGLNSFVGVVEYNGTTETAYSSNVSRHCRTSEWSPDEYGFYRTSDGYYVVASSDYEEGTIIETSRGEAMVLDDGCDSGWVDFYVNW